MFSFFHSPDLYCSRFFYYSTVSGSINRHVLMEENCEFSTWKFQISNEEVYAILYTVRNKIQINENKIYINN